MSAKRLNINFRQNLNTTEIQSFLLFICEKQTTYGKLRTRSLLLSCEEGVEGYVSDLDNLETDTGDITNGVTTSTESSNQNLIVFLEKHRNHCVKYRTKRSNNSYQPNF